MFEDDEQPEEPRTNFLAREQERHERLLPHVANCFCPKCRGEVVTLEDVTWLKRLGIIWEM